MPFARMIRRPSAIMPLALAGAALLTIVVHVALHGTAPQPDEGAAAHIWQLLMAAQLPALGYFAIRWLPEEPGAALRVLALHVVAILAALAPVYLLGF
jgi:hypothetical protein